MTTLLDEYFGRPDAAHEEADQIVSDHVPQSFESAVKRGDRTDGKQVIYGLKGSGKTEFRRYLERRDATPAWNLDVDHAHLNIDAVSLHGRSGVLKNTLAFALLQAFAAYLSEHAEEFELPKQQKGLKDRLSRVGEILKNVPNAVDISTPIGQVRLGELLKPQAASFLTTATKEVVRGILGSLGSKRVYIMIDDAEDVFPGLEKNPIFVEALARAVNDINRLAGNRIHVLLFLKYGIWRHWYEKQQEYDKVRPALQDISWNEAELRDLIARRVARIHGIKLSKGSDLDVENLWAKEFTWDASMSFEAFTAQFIRLCMSGPRDMIALANATKKAAGAQRIGLEHLVSISRDYSEDKLYGIGADFGDTYSDIAQFIEMVFQGCPVSMSGKDAAKWVYTHGLTAERVDTYFKSHAWYSVAGKERLVAIMYEVGLFGRLRIDGTAEYAMQRSSVTTSELLDSTLYVHPALQPHLAVQTERQVRPATDRKTRQR